MEGRREEAGERERCYARIYAMREREGGGGGMYTLSTLILFRKKKRRSRRVCGRLIRDSDKGPILKNRWGNGRGWGGDGIGTDLVST